MKKLIIILLPLISNFCMAVDTTIVVHHTANINDTVLLADTVIVTDAQTTQVDTCILPVVVMWGQSNEENANSNSPYPDSFKTAMTGIYIFFKPTNTSVGNGTIQTLKAGVNTDWRVAEIAGRVGVETGLAKYMMNAGKRIGIIKYAYQGSRLVDIGTLTTGHWQIDATHNFKHYSILVNNFVKPGLDSFRAKGYKPYIIALHWTQGEADSQDSVCASRYAYELQRLITQIKTDVPEAANIVTIATRTRMNWTYSSTVRQAQTTVPNYWINSDTWSLNSDGIHYTRTDQCTKHGKAIADIIIPLIP